MHLSQKAPQKTNLKDSPKIPYMVLWNTQELFNGKYSVQMLFKAGMYLQLLLISLQDFRGYQCSSYV